MSENFPITNLGIRDDGGVLLVNSRVVAERFERNHQHVLRSIDEIVHGLEVDGVQKTWFLRSGVPSTLRYQAGLIGHMT